MNLLPLLRRRHQPTASATLYGCSILQSFYHLNLHIYVRTQLLHLHCSFNRRALKFHQSLDSLNMDLLLLEHTVSYPVFQFRNFYGI